MSKFNLKLFVKLLPVLFLLGACSKDETTKEAEVVNEAPPNAAKEESNPQSEIVITEAQAEIYASRLGLEPSEAVRVLQEEHKFRVRLDQALSSKDHTLVTELSTPYIHTLAKNIAVAAVEYPTENNEKIPTWFVKLTESKGRSPEQADMLSPGYLGLDPKMVLEQTIVYNGVSRATEVLPDILAEITKTRFDQSATPVDAIIYTAISDGLIERAPYDARGDSVHSDIDAMVGSESIKIMSRSQNPIYRLFAARNSYRLKRSQRHDFLAQYVNETDDLTKIYAIDGLASLGDQEALDLLKQFQNSSNQQGLEDSAKSAELAISRIEKNSSQ